MLAKNRRALIIYGDGHLWQDAGFPTLASMLQSDPITRFFTIASSTLADLEVVQADVASWRAPSIAAVRGTLLGVKEFQHYFPVPPGHADQWRTVRLQDQFDSIAYYGPRKTLTYSEVSPSLCSDPVYMKMRLGRLAWVPPGAPNLAERLRQYCAKAAPK